MGKNKEKLLCITGDTKGVGIPSSRIRCIDELRTLPSLLSSRQLCYDMQLLVPPDFFMFAGRLPLLESLNLNRISCKSFWVENLNGYECGWTINP